MRSADHRTFTQYKPIDEITLSHIHQMHLVHQHRHPEVSLDQFICHMSTQTGALLVRRREDRLIVGFSTLRLSTLRRARRLSHGALVLHDAYGDAHGGHAGHARLLRRVVWLERLRRPFTPLQIDAAPWVSPLTSPLMAREADDRQAAQTVVRRAQQRLAVGAALRSR